MSSDATTAVARSEPSSVKLALTLGLAGLLSGLALVTVYQVTLPVCERYVDHWILVDEQQIADAVFIMLDKHHKVSTSTQFLCCWCM